MIPPLWERRLSRGEECVVPNLVAMGGRGVGVVSNHRKRLKSSRHPTWFTKWTPLLESIRARRPRPATPSPRLHGDSPYRPTWSRELLPSGTLKMPVPVNHWIFDHPRTFQTGISWPSPLDSSQAQAGQDRRHIPTGSLSSAGRLGKRQAGDESRGCACHTVSYISSQNQLSGFAPSSIGRVAY